MYIIPWTEKPGGLQFTGSQRVGHNSDRTTNPADLIFFSFTTGFYFSFISITVLETQRNTFSLQIWMCV